MLERLDQIDWKNLHHAYGSATDVPDLLRALTSMDADVRNEATDTLFGNIWHQGTVYQASAYAVPFLIELLTFKDIQDKEAILHLLHNLADGHSYLDVHYKLDSVRDWLIKRFQEEGTNFEREVAKELKWVRAAHEAVAVGIPYYLEIMEGEDTQLANYALALLALFPEARTEILPRLHALVQRATGEGQASGLLVFGYLSNDAGQATEWLEPNLNDSSEMVRFVSALSLARVLRDNTPPKAIDVLVNAVSIASIEEELDAYFAANYRFLPREPWGDLVFHASFDVVKKMGQERTMDLLTRLLHVVGARYDVVQTSEALLDLVFDGKQVKVLGPALGKNQQGEPTAIYWHKSERAKTTPAVLNTERRTILQELVNTPIFWQIETDLLELYGLPTRYQELRALLTQNEQSQWIN